MSGKTSKLEPINQVTTVFVVSADHGHEGYGEPLEVFSTRQKAQAWMATLHSSSLVDYVISEMILDRRESIVLDGQVIDGVYWPAMTQAQRDVVKAEIQENLDAIFAKHGIKQGKDVTP